VLAARKPLLERSDRRRWNAGRAPALDLPVVVRYQQRELLATNRFLGVIGDLLEQVVQAQLADEVLE
jgi:hypothetical protein